MGLHAILHTAGGVLAPPGTPEEAQAARDLALHPFKVFGVMRTYSDFHLGYGLHLSILLSMMAVLIWQLAPGLEERGSSIRPLVLLLSVATIAESCVSWRYFFMPPFVMELVIGLMLGLVWLRIPAKDGFESRPLAG